MVLHHEELPAVSPHVTAPLEGKEVLMASSGLGLVNMHFLQSFLFCAQSSGPGTQFFPTDH